MCIYIYIHIHIHGSSKTNQLMQMYVLCVPSRLGHMWWIASGNAHTGFPMVRVPCRYSRCFSQNYWISQ